MDQFGGEFSIGNKLPDNFWWFYFRKNSKINRISPSNAVMLQIQINFKYAGANWSKFEKIQSKWDFGFLYFRLFVFWVTYVFSCFALGTRGRKLTWVLFFTRTYKLKTFWLYALIVKWAKIYIYCHYSSLDHLHIFIFFFFLYLNLPFLYCRMVPCFTYHFLLLFFGKSGQSGWDLFSYIFFVAAIKRRQNQSNNVCEGCLYFIYWMEIFFPSLRCSVFYVLHIRFSIYYLLYVRFCQDMLKVFGGRA